MPPRPTPSATAAAARPRATGGNHHAAPAAASTAASRETTSTTGRAPASATVSEVPLSHGSAVTPTKKVPATEFEVSDGNERKRLKLPAQPVDAIRLITSTSTASTAASLSPPVEGTNNLLQPSQQDLTTLAENFLSRDSARAAAGPDAGTSVVDLTGSDADDDSAVLLEAAAESEAYMVAAMAAFENAVQER